MSESIWARLREAFAAYSGLGRKLIDEAADRGEALERYASEGFAGKCHALEQRIQELGRLNGDMLHAQYRQERRFEELARAAREFEQNLSSDCDGPERDRLRVLLAPQHSAEEKP